MLKKLTESTKLSSMESEYEVQINKAIEEHSQEWGMDLQQVRNALSLRGPKKLQAVASAIRTAQFMNRYKSELEGRGERMQELQVGVPFVSLSSGWLWTGTGADRDASSAEGVCCVGLRLSEHIAESLTTAFVQAQWWNTYMGSAKQKKDTEDYQQAFEVRWKGGTVFSCVHRVVLFVSPSSFAQPLHVCAFIAHNESTRGKSLSCLCSQYYSMMGWLTEDDVTDDRLQKLLKRATALKKVRPTLFALQAGRFAC